MLKKSLFLGVMPFVLAKPVSKAENEACQYTFTPDTATTYKNDYVPSLVNLTTSQLNKPTGSSWWANTFMTGDDGHQYILISHMLSNNATTDTVCRSSIYQVDTDNYWNGLYYCSPYDSANQTLPLTLELEDYGFVSTAADSISSMYTYGYGSDYSYNISWEATSTVLLNGGNAVIGFGPLDGNATEWGLPACSTTGTLTLNDTVVHVDPSNSFTWYDRQLSYSVPRNWTWFELHFPGTTKASIWAFDYPGSDGIITKRFATVRVDQYDNYVLAYTLTPDMDDVWISPNSNLIYPLSWHLNFTSGDYLDIKSKRPDQELYGSHSVIDSAYEGFIDVTGSFMGQSTGFGLVEMVTAYE